MDRQQQYPAKAVSIRADDEYIRALRYVADDRKVKVADLVRGIIDEALGAEIDRHLSFFAKSGNKNNQTVKNKDKKARRQ